MGAGTGNMAAVVGAGLGQKSAGGERNGGWDGLGRKGVGSKKGIYLTRF